MRFNNIKRTAICIYLFIFLGCTDNFEDINDNQNGIKQELLETKVLFEAMFNNILVLTAEWKYQIQQGLQGDIWSGYMATGSVFRGGTNNTTYDLVDSWNGTAWNTAYIDVMSNARLIGQISKGKFDQIYALSLILKVEGMHRLTDTYGPIVYSKYGTLDPVIEYDSQEEVYNLMFKELDFAVEELTKRIDANETSEFVKADLSSYKGDYKQWVKFANSLRLRLAMRIVKKNPTLAKAEAEKAVNQKFGVLVANSDVFKIISPTFTNPIAVISSSWTDIRMSADMESIMGGYNDPRLPIFFKESTQFPGQYKGIRTGIEIAAKIDHVNFSEIGPIVKTKEIVLMTTAEVYLLRAEGALRGWEMGGTAQSFYEMVFLLLSNSIQCLVQLLILVII